MAGAGGIEPPNDGIKIRCLTAWRRPKSQEQGYSACFLSLQWLIRMVNLLLKAFILLFKDNALRR